MSPILTDVVAVVSRGSESGISKYNSSPHSLGDATIGSAFAIACAHGVSDSTASNIRPSMEILIFTGMMENYSKFLNLTPVHQCAVIDESAGAKSKDLPQVFDFEVLTVALVQCQQAVEKPAS